MSEPVAAAYWERLQRIAYAENNRLKEINADLLGALELWMEQSGAWHGSPNSDNEPQKLARAAIAKARGESK